jgi:DNA polymerase-1
VSPKTLTGEELQLDDGPAKGSELFLVDGNNLAYRAFFALPEELQTTDGQPTNALLGFTNMLFKLLSDYAPHGVAVAWDTRPTHRTEIAETYKEGRRPMPDLLREQFPHFRPIVEAFGYRNLEFEGWEADDVIATLATRADEAGIKTCVVSTDRDAFQLCSENVSLMMTPRGVADVNVYTPERVELRYGIRPDQVPDFIGLKGDTSDNIPGIPGIGDKTAGQLIAQYGSLEEVIAHADELSPARGRAVREHAEQAAASKLLATMRRDLPLDVDPADLVSAPPDRSLLKEIFRRFEFRGLLSRVDTLDAALPSAAPVTEMEAVPWREAAREELVLGQHTQPLGVTWEDVRAGVATGTEVLVVEASLEDLRGAVGDAPLLAHDAKLLRLGRAPADDTLIAAYLVDPGRAGYDLDDLAREHGLELVPEPAAEEETAALVRRAEAARRPRRSCAPGCASGAWSGSTRTSSCPSPRCSRRWRTRGSRSTRIAWGRSPRGSRRGWRSSRRARSSSPERSSSSARRSSSRGSCSRSSSSPPAARARPGTRPTRASCVRSGTTTRSSPWSRSGAS